MSRKQTTNGGENVKKDPYTLLAGVWKLVWKILKILKIDGALAFLGLYPKNSNPTEHRYTYTSLLVAALW